MPVVTFSAVGVAAGINTGALIRAKGRARSLVGSIACDRQRFKRARCIRLTCFRVPTFFRPYGFQNRASGDPAEASLLALVMGLSRRPIKNLLSASLPKHSAMARFFVRSYVELPEYVLVGVGRLLELLMVEAERASESVPLLDLKLEVSSKVEGGAGTIVCINNKPFKYLKPTYLRAHSLRLLV
jgi:hypothetical protein